MKYLIKFLLNYIKAISEAFLEQKMIILFTHTHTHTHMCMSPSMERGRV